MFEFARHIKKELAINEPQPIFPGSQSVNNVDLDMERSVMFDKLYWWYSYRKLDGKYVSHDRVISDTLLLITNVAIKAKTE